MSLANAECVSESVRGGHAPPHAASPNPHAHPHAHPHPHQVREEGRLYTQITLTGALSGLSQDSFMQKGLSKLSKVAPTPSPTQTQAQAQTQTPALAHT